MTNRPPIPNNIKQEVRQRCGFGCVICGMPLYEYEHMLEWAQTKRHVADEITLLCRQHHGEKTNNLLPKADVEAANRDPYNKRVGVSKNHLLHYSGKSVILRISNSSFSYENMDEESAFIPLVIDATPLIIFRISQGKLFLSFIAHDEDNNLILEIDDNEITYDTNLWDVEWVGPALTIREARGRILLKLVFSPPNEIRITKGRILFNGVEVMIGENYLFNVNTRGFYNGINSINTPIGIAIGESIQGLGAGYIQLGIPREDVDRGGARRYLRRLLSSMRKKNKE